MLCKSFVPGQERPLKKFYARHFFLGKRCVLQEQAGPSGTKGGPITFWASLGTARRRPKGNQMHVGLQCGDLAPRLLSRRDKWLLGARKGRARCANRQTGLASPPRAPASPLRRPSGGMSLAPRQVPQDERILYLQISMMLTVSYIYIYMTPTESTVIFSV